MKPPQQQLVIQFGGEAVCLRHDGTAVLPKTNTLLVADLHLGKENSFRAQQIPVPEGPTETTLDLLRQSVIEVAPKHLVFLGDLIHDANSLTAPLIERLTNWRSHFPELKMTLVRGNHDRYVERFPEDWQFEEVDALQIANVDQDRNAVSLVHQAPANSEPQYFIEGHWHPVVKIGRGADQVRVRCFAHRGNRLTLPAFGPFKGGQVVSRRSATVYPIVEGYVLSNRSENLRKSVG